LNDGWEFLRFKNMFDWIESMFDDYNVSEYESKGFIFLLENINLRKYMTPKELNESLWPLFIYK
jgi:hypothetical protein